jgi:hypothetical protein
VARIGRCCCIRCGRWSWSDLMKYRIQSPQLQNPTCHLLDLATVASADPWMLPHFPSLSSLQGKANGFQKMCVTQGTQECSTLQHTSLLARYIALWDQKHETSATHFPAVVHGRYGNCMYVCNGCVIYRHQYQQSQQYQRLFHPYHCFHTHRE